MADITHRGCKELLFRRMFMAVASSIVVQFFFMSCVILINNLSITKPLSWLEDTWSIITCFRMWCYFLVLATVMVLQGVICSKDYLSPPSTADTRFAVFCSLFTSHNFTVGGLYLVIGVTLVWLHLSLEDGEWSSATRTCETTVGTCLIEEYLFLMIGGLWTGVYYFARTNFFGLKYLQFSIIPQTKFTKIRRGISSLVPTAAASAVWPTVHYLALYYAFGGYLRDAIPSTFSVHLEDEPLDRISRLLSVKLIFHTWLYASLFALTMSSMHLLFQAHLTEWMKFEIGQIYANSASITLAEALAMDRVPIIQHLGYLDLFTLSQKEKSRRALIFSLSQPGGHPYNWNCIVEKCLTLIRGFSKRVDEVSTVKQKTAVAPISTVPPNLDKPYVYKMRSLVAPAPVPTATEVDAKQTTSPAKFIAEFLRTKKQNFVNYLLSKPLIFHFFGVQNDSKIESLLLINGQPVIWAMDAVSSLASISLQEDSYGILQKDLPAVIESILTLKQSLDKLHKINLISRKPQQDDREVRVTLTALRSAARRAIYRIVMSFRDYIDDLALEPSVRDQLHPFFLCRE